MSRHYDEDRDNRLLEKLDEATARLLFPERFQDPPRIALRFPLPAGEPAARVAELAASAAHLAELADGRTEAVFTLDRVVALHELYTLLDEALGTAAVEVLVDGRRLPLARELWLPLLWRARS